MNALAQGRTVPDKLDILVVDDHVVENHLLD